MRVLPLLLLSTALLAQEYVRTDDQGRLVAIPLPIPAEFLNPWPAAYEDGFLTRADRLRQSVLQSAFSGRLNGPTHEM